MEGREVITTDHLLPRRIVSLLDLPNELLDHVFAILDTNPPSEGMFNDLPALTWPTSTHRTLKNISALSHRMRAIVQSRLFAHVRVDSDSIDGFLRFIEKSGLASIVDSIVIRVLHKKADLDGIWWCRLLDELPASRIVIQCKPELYQWIAKVDVTLDDSWAFNIPCQYIELHRSHGRISQADSCDPRTGLFAAKQWQSMSINEGSSLAAYTTYEYYLKSTPSLLANVQHYLNILDRLAEPTTYEQTFGPSAIPVMATLGMIANLREFSYIAVFPFYNHVDDILKCVRKMENLRKFFIKLCPEPDSTVLEDEIQLAKGHMDLNDPWNEAATSYDIIAYTVHTMGARACLETFTVGDLNVTGFRDSVQTSVYSRLQDTWTFDGTDTWTKQIDDEFIEAVLPTP